MTKSYSELIKFQTWQDRFDYLYLGDNKIGEATFGGHRWLNQNLYNSTEWKQIRRNVILRDNGCDMGVLDYPIPRGSKILIHHINPITIDDIINGKSKVFDMNNLISVSFNTHQMIHYGLREQMLDLPEERTPGDTKFW
jgi:hypothetical protein